MSENLSWSFICEWSLHFSCAQFCIFFYCVCFLLLLFLTLCSSVIDDNENGMFRKQQKSFTWNKIELFLGFLDVKVQLSSLFVYDAMLMMFQRSFYSWTFFYSNKKTMKIPNSNSIEFFFKWRNFHGNFSHWNQLEFFFFLLSLMRIWELRKKWEKICIKNKRKVEVEEKTWKKKKYPGWIESLTSFTVEEILKFVVSSLDRMRRTMEMKVFKTP